MGEELGRLQGLLENVLPFSGRKKRFDTVGEALNLGEEIRRTLAAMEPSMKRRGIAPDLDFEEGL